jgi:hypothetical protein
MTHDPTGPDALHHNNSNRRKLEFQTGVTDRVGDRAQSTNNLAHAYTPHQSKGCSR